MASPPSQEVDDINKKLIILPQATSEGVCQSDPLQSTHSPPLHISHSLHPQKTIGWAGGEKRMESEGFGREGKETFRSPSRLAIDESH